MASDPHWERLRADDTWNAWYLERLVRGTRNAWYLEKSVTMPEMHGTWNAWCVVPGMHGI